MSDRLIVEKAVRELMEVRKHEFLERADEMAKNVKKAVSKGGSSYGSLDGLIEYIKSLECRVADVVSPKRLTITGEWSECIPLRRKLALHIQPLSIQAL
ncbi:hypothetical protein C2S52_006795 [Perilla frutescens var. hirtella]|nr:hypothetical protein C2S52_006795 [Perilla frutescens var. hirtella]